MRRKRFDPSDTSNDIGSPEHPVPVGFRRVGYRIGKYAWYYKREGDDGFFLASPGYREEIDAWRAENLGENKMKPEIEKAVSELLSEGRSRFSVSENLDSGMWYVKDEVEDYTVRIPFRSQKEAERATVGLVDYLHELRVRWIGM